MAKGNSTPKGQPVLEGVGGAYIRVSDDKQDTARQYAAIRSFEERMGVTIQKQYWFKDEGWARDKADKRPAFQNLLKLAESKRIQWIVVEKLDRFGTKSPYQLIHFIYRLQEVGCRLFDALTGKDWTSEDSATGINAFLEGDKSKGEQISLSSRVLGTKAGYAKEGEWQGGPVRLGFDVVCFDRQTEAEHWRVVIEGRNKRVKVYPNGRKERSDGEGNFPKTQPTQVLRVSPSKDKSKIQAAVSVFKRFATEAIGSTVLAHYLNGLGFRNSYGGMFQGQQVEAMLEDPIYRGCYVWNKRHNGKFNRFSEGRVIQEFNYEEAQSKNSSGDWVQSKQLFKPLVDKKTWEAVQRKLKDKKKRPKAPRSAKLYLSGLVYCGNCGERMVAGPTRKPETNARKDGSRGDRYEYFCGTYHRAALRKQVPSCKCRRNGVFQDELERYIERWLHETNTKLEVLTESWDASELTAPLEREELSNWREFREGIDRLTGYLAKNHVDEYNELLGRQSEFTTSDDFVRQVVEVYKRCFDPKQLKADRDRLEAEHDDLYEKRLKLATPRTIAKADKELLVLESRMDELDRQSEKLADTVSNHYREVQNLAAAIVEAQRAMKGKDDERSMRQRGEALRKVIGRIECRFSKTGEKGGGWGKKNSLLTNVTIYPITGEPAAFSADSMGTLIYSSAHSCMYRTRVGSMR